MGIHMIRGKYWAEDIVNELVGLYYTEGLRCTEGVDYGVVPKWVALQDVLVAVACGGIPIVGVRKVWSERSGV